MLAFSLAHWAAVASNTLAPPGAFTPLCTWPFLCKTWPQLFFLLFFFLHSAHWMRIKLSARKLPLKGLGKIKLVLQRHFLQAIIILGSFGSSFCVGKQMLQNICCTQIQLDWHQHILLLSCKNRVRLQVNKKRVVEKVIVYLKASSPVQELCWKAWFLFSAPGLIMDRHLLWGINDNWLGSKPHPCLVYFWHCNSTRFSHVSPSGWLLPSDIWLS